MEHVFSAELDPEKRGYILDAFEDAQHVFGDVNAFSSGEGWCFRCGKTHRIDESMTIDVLLAGPSCKDLSFFEFACLEVVSFYNFSSVPPPENFGNYINIKVFMVFCLCRITVITYDYIHHVAKSLSHV